MTFLGCLSLKIKASLSFETVGCNRMTLCHVSEALNLQQSLLFECHISQVLLHIKHWCDTVSSGNVWNLCLQVLGRVNLVTGHVKTQLIAHDKEVYDIAFSRAGGGRDMFASVGECW